MPRNTFRGAPCSKTKKTSDNIIWLVVEPYPSEKYESQLGFFFPIYGKIIRMFQTTNQILILTWECSTRKPWDFISKRGFDHWISLTRNQTVSRCAVSWWIFWWSLFGDFYNLGLGSKGRGGAGENRRSREAQSPIHPRAFRFIIYLHDKWLRNITMEHGPFSSMIYDLY